MKSRLAESVSSLLRCATRLALSGTARRPFPTRASLKGLTAGSLPPSSGSGLPRGAFDATDCEVPEGFQDDYSGFMHALARRHSALEASRAVAALVVVCLLAGFARPSRPSRLPEAVRDRLNKLSVTNPAGYVELAEDILWGDLAPDLLDAKQGKGQREPLLSLVRGLAAKSYYLEPATSNGTSQVRLLAAVDELQQHYDDARRRLQYLVALNPLDHRALLDLKRLDRTVEREMDRRDRLLAEIVTLYLAGEAGEALPFLEALSAAERNTFLDAQLIAEVRQKAQQQAGRRSRGAGPAVDLPEPDCRFCGDTGVVDCDKCGGDGKRICSRCGGKGYVYEDAQKQVAVKRWKKLDDVDEDDVTGSRITVYERPETQGEDEERPEKKRTVWVRVTEMKTKKYSKRVACPVCLGSKMSDCSYCGGLGVVACTQCDRGKRAIDELRAARASEQRRPDGKPVPNPMDRVGATQRGRYVRLLAEIGRRQAGVLELEETWDISKVTSPQRDGPAELIPYDDRAKWDGDAWVEAKRLRVTVQSPESGDAVPADADALAFELRVTPPVPDGSKVTITFARTTLGLTVAEPLLSAPVPPDGELALVLTEKLKTLRRMAAESEGGRLYWGVVLRKGGIPLAAGEESQWLRFTTE